MSNAERLAEAVRSVRAANGSAVAAIEAAERKATVDRIRAVLQAGMPASFWDEASGIVIARALEAEAAK